MPVADAPLSDTAPVGLKAVQAPVADDLRVFRVHFREAMRSRVRLLDTVVRYLLARKGKQIRPTLVLLSAQLAGGVTARSYRAATLVELLHTATLVHDDVIDESDTRRGVASVRYKWTNKVGVLVGDYLLSRGLLLALDDRDYDLLHITSDAVRRMSEGELVQIETARRLDVTEDRYFQIIGDKTGSLIAACLAAGAASAGADDETVARAKAIGETIGLAFQIRDDLFDYDATAASIGKPVGLDLQDRKVTLPLILALDAASDADRQRIGRVVKKKRKSRAETAEVMRFVAETGAPAARARMEALAEDAARGLMAFPPSPARDALVGLCAYVVARKA